MRAASFHGYTVKKVLGKGAYGQVILVESKVQPNESFALKYYKLTAEATGILYDVAFMQLLQPSSIEPETWPFPRLYEYHIQPTQEQAWLIMDFMGGGDLMAKAKKKQPEALKRRIITQMVRALAYMHSHGIAHLDVKEANILGSDSNWTNVVMCDFTCSQIFGAPWKGSIPTPKSDSYISIFFRPPELALGSTNDFIDRADMWGLGIILFRMVFGNKTLSQISKDADVALEEVLGSWTSVTEREEEEATTDGGDDEDGETDVVDDDIPKQQQQQPRLTIRLGLPKDKPAIIQKCEDVEHGWPLWVVLFAKRIFAFIETEVPRLQQEGHPLADLAAYLPRLFCIDPEKRISSVEMLHALGLSMPVGAIDVRSPTENNNVSSVPTFSFVMENHMHSISFKRFAMLMRTIQGQRFDGAGENNLPLGAVLMTLFHSRQFLTTSYMLPVLMGLSHCMARFFELVLEIDQLKPLGTKHNLLEGCRMIFAAKIDWVVMTPDMDAFIRGWTKEHVRHFLVEHPEDLWIRPFDSIVGVEPVDCAKTIDENV
jgi:serine/threonine protein kinase